MKQQYNELQFIKYKQINETTKHRKNELRNSRMNNGKNE